MQKNYLTEHLCLKLKIIYNKITQQIQNGEFLILFISNKRKQIHDDSGYHHAKKNDYKKRAKIIMNKSD